MAWLADNLSLVMFVVMFFVIFCGYPVAFVLGALAGGRGGAVVRAGHR